MKGAAALTLAGSAGIPFTRLAFAQDEQAELKEGGILKVAIEGDPTGGLDAMFTTATLTGQLSQHVFESLFASNSSFAPQPHLVEDFELSDDGKSITMTLRSGLVFHNGQEVTAQDAVASLNRWGGMTSGGRLAFGRMDTLEATDDKTIVMTFNDATGMITNLLSSSSAFVMPADIAEAAGEDQLTEDQWVGTGPYKFQEHQPDQLLRMVRFDDYQSRDDAPDGAAGRRVAYLDELHFIPVSDPSVRANGVITGDYHWTNGVPVDFYDMLESDSTVVPLIVTPGSPKLAHLNKKQGVFTNKSMRHALQLSFSQSEAILAGFGREDFVRFGPSISSKETIYYSDAGAEAYDNPDPEKAKALAAEAGYNGEPIRWLANNQYAYNPLIGEFVAQEAESSGLNVEVKVTDWATYSEQRADPSEWEIFVTGHSSHIHPATQIVNDAEWPGWWDNEEKDRLVDEMIAAPTDEARQQAIDDWTALFWEEMPSIILGEELELRVHGTEVKNYQNVIDSFFWNVGLE